MTPQAIVRAIHRSPGFAIVRANRSTLTEALRLLRASGQHAVLITDDPSATGADEVHVLDWGQGFGPVLDAAPRRSVVVVDVEREMPSDAMHRALRRGITVAVVEPGVSA